METPKLSPEILNIVCVIESASGLSIYEVIDGEVSPWYGLWLEEIELNEKIEE